MLNSEEIRANRSKFRAAIKVEVVEAVVEPRLSAEKSEEASPTKRMLSKEDIIRQRKKSEDLSIFENPCRNRDVYINSKFFDLFTVG